MGIQDLKYDFDRHLFDYEGKNPLKVYVRKIEKNNQMTYSIEPIRAQSKLFFWLQGRCQFFNRLITSILSFSIRRNVDCKIFDDLYVLPKPSINGIINELMNRVENEANGFFNDFDIENHRNAIYLQIIANAQFTEDKKIDLLIPTLTSTDRLKALLEKVENNPHLKLKVIEGILDSADRLDKEILDAVMEELLPNLHEYKKELQGKIYNYLFDYSDRYSAIKTLNFSKNVLFKEEFGWNLRAKALKIIIKNFDPKNVKKTCDFLISLFMNLNRKKTSEEMVEPLIELIFENTEVFEDTIKIEVIYLLLKLQSPKIFETFSDPNTIAQFIMDHLNEFDPASKIEFYSLVLESYYKHRAPIDKSIVADIVKNVSDIVTCNIIGTESIIPLAQIIEQNCPQNTFSSEVRKKIKNLINWDDNNFRCFLNEYKINIQFPFVKIRPERVLQSFYKQCFLQDRRCVALSVSAQDNDQNQLSAVDLGGLRRQFVSDLFEGLAKKVSLGTSEELSSVENSLEGWIPKLSKYDQTKQENLYITIGKIMGMCLTSVGQMSYAMSFDFSYVTGKVFDPAVFDVIALAHPRILDLGFKNLDDNTLIALYNALEKGKNNKLLQFYNTQNFSTCSEKTLQEMVTYAYVEDPEEMPHDLEGVPTKATILKHQNTLRAKLRSQILTYAKENDSLPLILKIAEGMAYHYYDRNTWSYRNWSNMSNLESRVQGSFDKQTIKIAIKFNSTSISYLKRWIDESDDAMVQKFLRATTGSNTIASNISIKVNYIDASNRLPEYHTCSRSVDIPSYRNYITFKTKLEQSFNCLEGEGFQLK